MIEYRFARADDLDELIDFINMIFSMMRVPHDFAAMLPKVYGDAHRLADIHAIAVENGRICGCVGTYVYPLRVGEQTLRMGYIGSVSVHRRVRGMGVMRRLMEMNIQRAREEKLDMLVLGGQRQRYEYYGFTPCGATYSYSLSASNVRHALRELNADEISIRPMEEQDVPFALECYNRQRVAGARTQSNFLDTAVSYRNQPWLVCSAGKPAGYLIASADGKKICELAAENEKLKTMALKKWLELRELRSVQIDAAPYDRALNQALAPICEGFSLAQNGMLLCLNYANVILAYMQLKHEDEPLADGEFSLAISDDETIRISVRSGEIQIEQTDAADVSLDGIQAQQLLFGYNPYVLTDLRRQTPAGWFPLPFHIPEPDTF